MRYPMNTALGRFGIETATEETDGCVASMPVAGMVNPFTGAPTLAPLALLVDHVGGLMNHLRRTPDEWTVSSELSLDVAPSAAAALSSAPAEPVVGVSRPVGDRSTVTVAVCELTHCDVVIGTATVRSFLIESPGGVGGWPDFPAGDAEMPGLAEKMAVHVGSDDQATVLMQSADPVLNNSIGIVHGGVSVIGLGLVAEAALHAQPGAGSLQLASVRANYLRPFHSGPQSRYVGSVLRVGRRSGVAEAQAVGGEGKPAIVARVTAYS